MLRTFIKKNASSSAILLFLVIFITIQIAKPSFIYNNDGSFRQFGLGWRKKTVIPIWLITIFVAILSYVFVLYYLNLPKYKF
tara:strand:+ start:43 stop:288 length:246 start_codon:yes stop_codon:yes gene_type:complete